MWERNHLGKISRCHRQCCARCNATRSKDRRVNRLSRIRTESRVVWRLRLTTRHAEGGAVHLRDWALCGKGDCLRLLLLLLRLCVYS
eukprot:07436_4